MAQIKESLKQVHSKHPNVSRWTLVIAKDFTPGETRWFNQLRKDYSTIKLDIWDNTKLNDLLRNFYRIRYDFFPIPEHVDKNIFCGHYIQYIIRLQSRALLMH
jgi:hypothetical protein